MKTRYLLTYLQPEYGGYLFALQTDESCKGMRGPFWNLCIREHFILATPAIIILNGDGGCRR